MAKGKRTRPYGLSIRMTAEERKAVQNASKNREGRKETSFFTHFCRYLLSIITDCNPCFRKYGALATT